MGLAAGAYGVSKSFGAVKALDNISFEVPESTIFGFIGPDGSGKTTLFRLAATLLIPDEGSMSVFGYNTVSDYRHLRKITGYMPGRFSLYQDLTVEENLNFYATVFGTTVKENYELIRDIYSHLEPFRKRVAGNLSGGMKQKLALSCALIHKPRLLILDEPTTGVDAVSRTEFWEMLTSLKESDITVLVSTPYMDEAVKCDSIALIQKGRILCQGTPPSIIRGYSGQLWYARAPDTLRLLTALRKYHLTSTAYPFGDAVHITFNEDSPGEELEKFLMNEGVSNLTISEANPTIEDRFLQLMKGGDLNG
jgi:ABC-2 type transport system ATP-binding protein